MDVRIRPAALKDRERLSAFYERNRSDELHPPTTRDLLDAIRLGRCLVVDDSGWGNSRVQRPHFRDPREREDLCRRAHRHLRDIQAQWCLPDPHTHALARSARPALGCHNAHGARRRFDFLDNHCEGLQ